MELVASTFQPPQMAAKRLVCRSLSLVQRLFRFLATSRGSLLTRRRDHIVGIFTSSGPTITMAHVDMVITVAKNWPFRAQLMGERCSRQRNWLRDMHPSARIPQQAVVLMRLPVMRHRALSLWSN